MSDLPRLLATLDSMTSQVRHFSNVHFSHTCFPGMILILHFDYCAGTRSRRSDKKKKGGDGKSEQSLENDLYVVAKENDKEADKEDNQTGSDSDVGSVASSEPGGEVDEEGDVNPEAEETMHERLERLNLMARGEFYNADELSSDDEDLEGDGDDSDSDMEDIDLKHDPEAPDLSRPVMATEEGEETRRLAAVNLDWDQLRAVDLLVALQSFAPAGGVVKKISIIPSEYGAKRMEEENRHGPRNIFVQSEEEDKDKKNKKSSTVVLGKSSLHPSNKDSDEPEFDPIALRAYELNKLKYYFAVIECDTVETATALYNTCDGLEYEATSNMFDLRFIPDDVTFERAPRDEATNIPDDYTPPEFSTKALQSSRVELTWDADDAHRARALNWEKLKEQDASASKKRKGRKGRKGRKDEEVVEDPYERLKDYIASSGSSSSESEVEEDNATEKGKKEKARKLRALLLGDDAADVDDLDSDEDGSEDDSDSDDSAGLEIDFGDGSSKAKKGNKFEKKKKSSSNSDDLAEKTITFNPELKTVVTGRIQEKNRQEAPEEENTLWEKYQKSRKEKLKEKKKRRKEEIKKRIQGGDASSSFTSDDDEGDSDMESDPFFASASDNAASSARNKRDLQRQKKLDEAEAERQRQAELEILMIGDDEEGDSDRDDERNYSLVAMRQAQKKLDREKKKKKRELKHKKLRGQIDSDDEQDALTALEQSAAPTSIDTHDPRFQAVLSAPEYAIDPNAPQYKDTPGMRLLLKERLDRNKRDTEPGSSGGKDKNSATQGSKKRSKRSEDADEDNDEDPKRKKRPMVVTAVSTSALAPYVDSGEQDASSTAVSEGASQAQLLAKSLKARLSAGGAKGNAASSAGKDKDKKKQKPFRASKYLS